MGLHHLGCRRHWVVQRRVVGLQVAFSHERRLACACHLSVNLRQRNVSKRSFVQMHVVEVMELSRQQTVLECLVGIDVTQALIPLTQSQVGCLLTLAAGAVHDHKRINLS